MTKTPEKTQEVPCEHCGEPEAREIGEHHLCLDCYAVRSSACAGSGEADGSC